MLAFVPAGADADDEPPTGRVIHDGRRLGEHRLPEGRARLRITLSAVHSPGDVGGLIEALARARDATQRLDVIEPSPVRIAMR